MNGPGRDYQPAGDQNGGGARADSQTFCAPDAAAAGGMGAPAAGRCRGRPPQRGKNGLEAIQVHGMVAQQGEHGSGHVAWRLPRGIGDHIPEEFI